MGCAGAGGGFDGTGGKEGGTDGGADAFLLHGRARLELMSGCC